MDVLRYSQSKVAHVATIAESAFVDVDARAEQLDDVEREIGEVLGIGGATARQKLAQRDVVRLVGKLLSDFRGQRYDAIPPLGLLHDASQRCRAVIEQKLRDRSI